MSPIWHESCLLYEHYLAKHKLEARVETLRKGCKVGLFSHSKSRLYQAKQLNCQSAKNKDDDAEDQDDVDDLPHGNGHGFKNSQDGGMSAKGPQKLGKAHNSDGLADRAHAVLKGTRSCMS
jgi:hypothetical protein